MVNKKSAIPVEQSHISSKKLKSRQSVRTTFKLPEETINLLGLMADQLGLKQKSLLDQLLEDTDLIEELIEETNTCRDEDVTRLPKTYVLSKNSLQSINKLAQNSNVSRDAIIEISIRRLTPLIETERAKHLDRKKIVYKMKKQLIQQESLRNEAFALLGKDDELLLMLDKQLEIAKKNYKLADDQVTKGVDLESW
jgi:hypothetical protein